MALLQITEPGEAVDPHQRKRAAGIDLGTTNSLIASYRAGEVHTLPDESGQHLLPSVVRYLADGTTVVGAAALAAAKADPANTVISAKRLMGRGIGDVKQLGDRLPYNFVPGEGGMPLIQTVGGDISPVETSATILRTLALRAEASLGGDLDGVVITVPAYFDDAQRQATKDAARIANLNVLRLLNEPTAAAVAYGLDSGAEGVIAIFDLGGGTFDISLLRLNRGVFEVLATGGDSALGGDDFDRTIAEWIIQQSGFEGDINLSQHRGLMLEARVIKEALSSAEQVAVNIELEDICYEGELSRSTFESLIEPLLSGAIKACRRAVRDASVTTDEISSVVMVGGSTRVPAVLREVGKFFECEPMIDIDPDKVVAIGAAIQANVLIGNKSDDEMLLLDVLPLSLGLETMGGLTEKIIHRNTAIPVSRAQEFTTYKDGQTAMLVHVVQGERELVQDCRSLARFELRGIPPMVAGAAKIAVLFQVDADGLLNVTATELSQGVEARVEVKPSYGLSDAQVTQMLKASFEYAEADVAARTLTEARVEAERVLDAVKNALAVDGEALLDEEEREEINTHLQNLALVMAAENAQKITQFTESLAAATDEFAARRMDQSVRTALSGRALDELEKE